MRKIKFLSVFLLTLLLGTGVAFGQGSIRGRVIDAQDGSPVSGATIKVKGGKGMAVSQSDGSFEISATPGSVLEISEIGHLNTTYKVSGTGAIEIRLAQDTKSLSEVVVTGVGVATTKKKVAIDVASMNVKDAGKSSVASVEQALQGRIAGANIQFTSGLPGTNAQIVLRGLNDLNGDGPIILVDGVEIKGGLTGLDLSAIERVEVVKGAAGGTLYGAQGQNGVIQIFTKKGTKGRKPTITVQSQLSSDQILRGKELLAQYHHFNTDSAGFIVNSSGTRLQPDDNNGWPDPQFGDAGLTGFDRANVVNNKPYKEPLYDHLDQAYRTAMTHNTNVNIAGGGDNMDYAFNFGFLNQQNVLFNGYKRYNLGTNLGFNLAKGLTFRTNTQAIFTDEDLLAGGSRFNLTNSWRFIDFTAKDSKGNTVVKPKINENQLNPLSEREWRDRTSKNIRIIQNANINYKFARFLELDYKYGIEFSNSDNNDFIKNQTDAPQSGSGFWGSNVKGSITSVYSRQTFQNSLATAYLRFDFDKDFNAGIPLTSTTQVSYDWRKINFRQFFAQGTELPPYPPYNISVANTKVSGDYRDGFTTYGVLLNQTFDYGNLFGVSAGLRRDLSSEFGEGKDAKTFYRGTAYFRLSEVIKSSLIADWKIRGAFGQAGQQPYSFRPFARQVVLDVSTIGVGGSGLSLATQTRNTKLRLATTEEQEIGTDLTLRTNSEYWFSRLIFSATYWKRNSKDAYQYADQSLSTGSSQILDNLTTLSSNGLDLSLDADVLQKDDFTWNFGIRFSRYSGTVDKIANSAPVVAGIFTLAEGQQLGTFSAQTPLTALDQTKPDKTPYIAEADRGKYTIVNGMVVDTATHQVFVTSAADQKLLGSAIPKFNASFIQNFTIKKNLTIGLQFDWRYGNKIYNLTRQWLYRDRLHADFDNSVTIGDASGAFVQYYNSLYNNVSPISWFVESGSMLRLRDASISYSLNDKWRPKFLRSATITLAGRNLFTITDYSGLDPEATNTSDAQGNSAPQIGVINGVDYFGVPNLRSYILTLNLGL